MYTEYIFLFIVGTLLSVSGFTTFKSNYFFTKPQHEGLISGSLFGLGTATLTSLLALVIWNEVI